MAQARDPVAYSIADNLFWNDILMEHALFFVQLMPGRELDEPRRQAEEFNRLFAQDFEQSRALDAGNYIAFNQRSVDHAKRFSDWQAKAESTPKSTRGENSSGARPIEVVGTSTAGFVGIAAVVLGGLVAASLWLVAMRRSVRGQSR